MQSKNRSGEWRKNLSGELAYNSFVPAVLPPVPDISLDEECLRLLVKANKELAYLDGAASMIPSLPLFVSMYVRKEALAPVMSLYYFYQIFVGLFYLH